MYFIGKTTTAMTLPFGEIDNALKKYRNDLRCRYQNLPEISTEGWFDDTVEKKYINVTLKKSIDINMHSMINYNSHPEHLIEGEVVYDKHEYVMYDDIFGVKNECFQLMLIEGNAGTGKTSLAYKVCREWAQEHVLQNYHNVILVQLRTIKSMNISVKTLLTAMGQPVNDKIRTKVSDTNGKGILIWLEGWDELDDKLIKNRAFDNLLTAKMFPLATIVITTRPSATRSLKRYNDYFTHKFKVIGFVKKQRMKYVTRYFASDNLAESFKIYLKAIPGLTYLAEIPLFLAILVKLFKSNRQTPLPRKLTDVCSTFLMACLQHHKEKVLGDNQPINSFDELPTDMKKLFHSMQKCAYERYFHHSNAPFTETEISHYFFNSKKVPKEFDGFGMLSVKTTSNVVGESKVYDFIYKPTQELLSALYLTRLNENHLIDKLSETFGNKKFEVVWVFYAGLTDLKQISLKKMLEKCKMTLPYQTCIKLPAQLHSDLVTWWNKCKSYYENVESRDFLLPLILCCYEANNSEACSIIAKHFYADDVCRLDIPPIYANPYLLLAVSYFLTHCGKTWSLRCNNTNCVSHLFRYINDRYQNLRYSESMNHLWVLCCVVTSTEVDDYCRAIKWQSSLQWIHLLPGSHLGDEGTYKLCKYLSTNNSVIRVEIDDCGIGSQGLQYIGDLLKFNKKILYIDVRKNMFKPDDVEAFLQKIKNESCLQILLLDKIYCENPEISAAVKEIEQIRASGNAFHVTHDSTPFYM